MKDTNTSIPRPVCVDVKAGKIYKWCGCGKSNTLPFCDNSKCGNQAINYQAIHDSKVFFCNCRQSKEPPLCDGSHAKLFIKAVKKKKC